MIFGSMYQVMTPPRFKPFKGFPVYLEQIHYLTVVYKAPDPAPDCLFDFIFYISPSHCCYSKLTFSLYFVYANLIPD